MPIPTERELLSFFARRRNQAMTLRELMHAFTVERSQQNFFHDWLDSLAKERRIVRLKSKLFRAAPGARQPEPARASAGHHKPSGHKTAGRPPLRHGERDNRRTPWKPESPPPPEVVGVLVQVRPKIIVRVSGERDELLPAEGDLSGLAVGDAAVWKRASAARGEGLSLVLPLGDPKEPRVAAYAIAAESGFLARFSPEAERAAAQFPQPTLGEGRVDLRALPLCTIDGEDAKDFDDAVFAERQGDGFRLIVAIADVGHYVRPGSILDREGYARGTSVYLPGFALPMLPHALSDQLCSLQPEVDRLAVAAEMQVSAAGQVSGARTYRALIRSHARLTYREVEDALHRGRKNRASALGQPLVDFAACSRALRVAKERRGAIDLDLPEPGIVLDAAGKPTATELRSRLESHRLIEDAMLACNSAIAREMGQREWPAAYRVHAEPKAEKLETLRQLCHALGYRLPLADRPKARDLGHFIDKLTAEKKGKVLLPYVLRCLARAHYDPSPRGHFALAEPDYLHFTSPIRRFPDLIVHRSLTSQGEESPKALAAACEHLSEREQASERCQRDTNDHYRCLYALPHTGEEFPAVVTGVLDFGAFVQVREPHLEGLIPARTLGDNFELDHAQTRLTARRSGAALALGDEVKVKLKEVRLAKRQIEFEWVR